MKYYDIYLKEFGLNPRLLELAEMAEKESEPVFMKVNKIREHNQIKVLRAMQKYNLSDAHFFATTGYGYNDRGRETLDKIYADVFGAEDALVRHNITCGTHALGLCLFGVLRPGDEMVSISGKPYDTLEEVIGIRGKAGSGSLKDYGVKYKQVELFADGVFDKEGIAQAVNKHTKLIFIQRSHGYEWRKATTIEKISKIVKFIRSFKKDIIIMVDNCYGEFVETLEPTDVDVDIVAGSLIKNPGGGLVPSGGYIAGKKRYVELISYRMTVPGLGREVGATLGHTRLMVQGLFLAPHVVAESLKGAIFCASLMKRLGFKICPEPKDVRSDIIQAIRFNTPEEVISFCQGIQKGSPVDSHVVPQPWDMPGYDDPVIMAAGAFIQGSSIELSADAPIRPPYNVYLQGGLVYEHVKLGVLCALQNMINEGCLIF